MVDRDVSLESTNGEDRIRIREALRNADLNFQDILGLLGASGSAIDVDTKTTLESLSISDGVDALTLKGYLVSGDGGAATYARADAEPSHPGKIQDGAGNWWELIEPRIKLEMLGGVGNNSTDNAQAFSDAFAVAKARGTNIVELGAGVYDTSESIIMDAPGLQLIGQGPGSRDTVNDALTRIHCTSTSGAIVEPKYENCVVQGITFSCSAARLAATVSKTLANYHAGVLFRPIASPPAGEGDIFQCRVEDCVFWDQAGDGIAIGPRGYQIVLRNIYGVNATGRGVAIVGGVEVGLADATVPGIVDMDMVTWRGSEGYALQVGNETVYGFRVTATNCEFGEGGDDAAQRVNDATATAIEASNFVHCDGFEAVSCAFDGGGRTALAWAGDGGTLHSPRILDATIPVRFVALTGRTTRSLEVDAPLAREMASASVWVTFDSGVGPCKLSRATTHGGVTAAATSPTAGSIIEFDGVTTAYAGSVQTSTSGGLFNTMNAPSGSAVRNTYLKSDVPYFRHEANTSNNFQLVTLNSDNTVKDTIYTVNHSLGALQLPNVRFTGPFQPAPYTVATLPTATLNGQVIYIADGDSGDPCLAFWDGSAWVNITGGGSIGGVSSDADNALTLGSDSLPYLDDSLLGGGGGGSANYLTAEDDGAVGDGTTDDRAALSTATNRASELIDLSGGNYRVTSNNVTQTTLNYVSGGRVAVDNTLKESWLTENGTVKLSSTYTWRMANGSGLADIALIRDGMTFTDVPNGSGTSRALDATDVANYAGTAVDIISGATTISNAAFLGFGTAIYSSNSLNSARVKLRDLMIDCTNGIDYGNDTGGITIEHVECKPILSGVGADSATLDANNVRSGIGINIRADTDNPLISNCFTFNTDGYKVEDAAGGRIHASMADGPRLEMANGTGLQMLGTAGDWTINQFYAARKSIGMYVNLDASGANPRKLTMSNCKIHNCNDANLKVDSGLVQWVGGQISRSPTNDLDPGDTGEGIGLHADGSGAIIMARDILFDNVSVLGCRAENGAIGFYDNFVKMGTTDAMFEGDWRPIHPEQSWTIPSLKPRAIPRSLIADGSTVAATANQIYLFPFEVKFDYANVIDRLAFEVTTLHASNAVIGLYMVDAETGLPGERIEASAAISCNTTGTKTDTLASTSMFWRKIVYAAITFEGTPTVRAGANDGGRTFGLNGSGNPVTCISVARTYDGTLPTTLVGSTFAHSTFNALLTLYQA